ncbi:MAG: amidohydrolase family protein [Acidobacteria bacterium]|nr:amidohydrolase family protein [Acidobacteriota bacterium]
MLKLFAAAAIVLSVAWTVLPQESDSPDSKKTARKALTLKAERKIEFSTDEGTWISLDVSPDGTTIVFELAGDIYTLPMAGGKASRIVSGMGFESQPVYSPGGERIAFLSDREGSENVWIADAAGANLKPLTKDPRTDWTSPEWTPDGKYVLASKTQRTASASGTEIWMYHVDGGSGVQVTRGAPAGAAPSVPRTNSRGVAPSPDGKYFYYARRNGGFTYNANFPLWQIVRRDRVTGDEDELTEAHGSAFRPALSPDGSKLVFATRYETRTGLRIRDLNTGDERWLKYPVQRDDQESRASRDVLPGYSFTPDSKSLVVAYEGKIRKLDIATGQDTVIPFTADVSLDIGPLLDFPTRVEEGPVRARLIQHPTQSPDGKRVAFTAFTHLYAMDLPGGTPRRIAPLSDYQYQPAWSPDGLWLVYVSWQGGAGHLWKVRADGAGAPIQLSRTPGYYHEPAWSPAGDRIVMLRSGAHARLEGERDGGSPVGSDLVWIPASGGDVTLIAPARGRGRPHFTTHPGRVFVYSQQGLISMKFDGTDRRTHVRIVGPAGGAPEPPAASDARMGPDGKWALALVTRQLYLVGVPQAGGEAPIVNVSSASTPVKKLTTVGADYFEFADSGNTVAWGLGASFFRVSVPNISFDGPGQPASEEFTASVEMPRAAPQGTVVLRGARAITMKGDEVIPDADIVVTNNRIVSVGPRGARTPPGARLIDLKGATVMPGIIDAHAHWRVRRGVLDMQAWSLAANLAYGVTTGRDPQTMTNDMLAYQDLIDAGVILGPRAYSTGPGVFFETDFQSYDEAKAWVTKYAKYYRTNTLKSYVVGNRRQRQWMVEACKELKIMPTTEGALDLKLDFTHAIDGFSGNEHALPIVPLYKDVVEVFARSGITYTPTLLVAYGGPWAENYFYATTEVYNDKKLQRFIPQSTLESKAKRRPWFAEDEHVFAKLAAEAAKVERAGGRVAIGGHGQLQGIQCHWEMWALKAGGWTNHEVLRAATLNGARAIGLAQDLGSIEPGKLADLVILNRNPLEEIRHTNAIRYVMKNGELLDGATLDQIWPKSTKAPEMWWWKERP